MPQDISLNKELSISQTLLRRCTGFWVQRRQSRQRFARCNFLSKLQPVSPYCLAQIRVMSWKNFRTLPRSPGYLLFQFLLPMLQAILFCRTCSALGLDLHSIPVAAQHDGDQSYLSSVFVHKLGLSRTAQPHMYPTKLAALDSVCAGVHPAGLIIPANFESALI